MGQTEIAELEKLVNQDALVAPIEYKNPNREKDIFCDFILQYAELLGIIIDEKMEGFFEWQKSQLRLVRSAISDSKQSLSERIFYGTLGTIGFVVWPIAYPLAGTVGHIDVNSGGDQVIVSLPAYPGPIGLIWPHKVHEYMHVYQHLIEKNLEQEGLLPNIDKGDVINIEPPHFGVPDLKDLKRYERKVLNKLIEKERKYSKSQTPIMHIKFFLN